MAYEPFRTCDLADIGTKKGGAGVAHIFIQRFEDATHGLKLQSVTATLSWNVTLGMSSIWFVSVKRESFCCPYLSK